MKLKAEFADLRVCSRCGAPAEKFAEPIEIPCHRNCDGTKGCAGCEQRWKDKEVGGRVKSTPYFVRVITHCCIRANGEDAAGKPSVEPRHEYHCGAIALTRQVSLEQADPRCFEEDGRLM